MNTLPHTFYSGFLLICKMFSPGPDDYIYIVNTEDLRKTPQCVTTTLTGRAQQFQLSWNGSFQQTFASNPLTTSVFSLLQPQIPDLILWKEKHKTWHISIWTAHTKNSELCRHLQQQWRLHQAKKPNRTLSIHWQHSTARHRIFSETKII